MAKRLTVFLCHASQDKVLVRQVHEWLKENGFAPWLDEVDLLPGMDWRLAIRESISSSDIFLVLLTQNSISKRGFVQSEIRTALEELRNVPTGQIFVIPALLDHCEIPPDLSNLQAVDIRTQSGKERLLGALNHKASQLGRYNRVPDAEAQDLYRKRVEAIGYTLAHDDGQSARTLDAADLIIIGLSRSGKTPLSIYLAVQFGIKAATYPLIPEDFDLGRLPKIILGNADRVVALIVPPEQISAYRNNRRPGSKYASLQNCKNECDEALKLISASNIRQLKVDYSGIAVEELALVILRDMFPEKLIY